MELTSGEVIIPLAGIVGVFILPTLAIAIIAFYYHRNKSRERLAMIEKGLDISELYKIQQKAPHRKGQELKFGIVAMGVGLGILTGYLLESNDILHEDIAYGAMVLLFTGGGLLASHFLTKDERSEN